MQAVTHEVTDCTKFHVRSPHGMPYPILIPDFQQRKNKFIIYSLNPDSMKFRGPNLLFHIMRVSYYLGLTVNAQF